MSTDKYSVTIVPDHEGEPFSESVCRCEICLSMHLANIEWDNFAPQTALQRNMKKVVSKIESDIRKRKTRRRKSKS